MHSPRLLLATLPIVSWGSMTEPQRMTRNRGRWIIVLLTAGVLLDLLISVVLVYQNRQIEHAASSAHISRVASYASCLKGNDYRAEDQARWDAIIKLLQADGTTPEGLKFIAGVQAANKLADHPVNCQPLRP
jgi:hypothetical protein